MHHIRIPVDGLVEVLHFDPATSVEKAEDLLAGEGRYVSVQISETASAIHFRITPTDQPVNTRARAAVAALFGLHFVLTGPVLLSNVDEEQVVEALKILS